MVAGNTISYRFLALQFLLPFLLLLYQLQATNIKMSDLQRMSRRYSALPALHPPVMQAIVEEDEQSYGVAPDEMAPASGNVRAVGPARQSHVSAAATSEYFASVSSVIVPIPKRDSLFSGFTFTLGRLKRNSHQSSQSADQNSRSRTFGSLRDSIVDVGKHLIGKKRKREEDDEGQQAVKSFVVLRRPQPHCQGCRCHPAHRAADAQDEAEVASEREDVGEERGRSQLRVVRPIFPTKLPSPAPSLRWAAGEADFFRRLVLVADGEGFGAGLS